MHSWRGAADECKELGCHVALNNALGLDARNYVAAVQSIDRRDGFEQRFFDGISRQKLRAVESSEVER